MPPSTYYECMYPPLFSSTNFLVTSADENSLCYSMSFSWSSSFSSKTSSSSSSSFYSLLLSFQFELELSTHFWWKRRSSACQNVIFASTARRQPERLLVPVVALTHYSLLWTPTNQTTKLLPPRLQHFLNDEDGGRGGLWRPLQLLLL